MWPILLKILSIIGIALGGIVGFILLLVLLILLAPITYNIKGYYHADTKEWSAKAKVHYLFGILGASAVYPEPGRYYVRVLWIHLIDSVKKEKKSNKQDIKKPEPARVVVSDNNEEKELDLLINSQFSDSDKKEKDKKQNNNTKEKASNISRKESKAKDKKEKKHFELKSPLYYIKKKWLQLKHKFVDPFKLKYKDITFYKKLWDHPDTQVLIASFKKRLLKLLKMLLPKGGYANITYGTGAPDTTAYIFGVYAMMSRKWSKKIVITPDFEKAFFDGDGNIKGWFNLLGILIQVLPIVLSKKLRLTKARYDKHVENMEISKRKAEKRAAKEDLELEQEYAG